MDRQGLAHWLRDAAACLTGLLDLLVGYHPQCLFPVIVRHRFGFNTPVGALFDVHHAVGLPRVLGRDKYVAFRKHFSADEGMLALLAFYESFPPLTDEEALGTFVPPDGVASPADEDRPTLERVMAREALQMATTRASALSFAYAPPERQMVAKEVAPGVFDFVRMPSARP